MARSGKGSDRKPAGGGEDVADVQRRLTRALIFELREDLDDLLAGLDAGTLDYVLALKTFKFQLQELLADPLVGAVEANFKKVTIKIEDIDVPEHLTKKKRARRRGKE